MDGLAKGHQLPLPVAHSPVASTAGTPITSAAAFLRPAPVVSSPLQEQEEYLLGEYPVAPIKPGDKRTRQQLTSVAATPERETAVEVRAGGNVQQALSRVFPSLHSARNAKRRLDYRSKARGPSSGDRERSSVSATDWTEPCFDPAAPPGTPASRQLGLQLCVARAIGPCPAEAAAAAVPSSQPPLSDRAHVPPAAAQARFHRLLLLAKRSPLEARHADRPIARADAQGLGGLLHQVERAWQPLHELPRRRVRWGAAPAPDLPALPFPIGTQPPPQVQALQDQHGKEGPKTPADVSEAEAAPAPQTPPPPCVSQAHHCPEARLYSAKALPVPGTQAKATAVPSPPPAPAPEPLHRLTSAFRRMFSRPAGKSKPTFA